jgi:hypothetical protein
MPANFVGISYRGPHELAWQNPPPEVVCGPGWEGTPKTGDMRRIKRAVRLTSVSRRRTQAFAEAPSRMFYAVRPRGRLAARRTRMTDHAAVRTAWAEAWPCCRRDHVCGRGRCGVGPPHRLQCAVLHRPGRLTLQGGGCWRPLPGRNCGIRITPTGRCFPRATTIHLPLVAMPACSNRVNPVSMYLRDCLFGHLWVPGHKTWWILGGVLHFEDLK